jgi:predicted thioesterase
VFRVEATTTDVVVARGVHERAIVDKRAFEARLVKKTASAYSSSKPEAAL